MVTLTLGGPGYEALAILKDGDKDILTQYCELWYKGETVNLYAAINTLINTIRNNGVDCIIIDDDITRWAVEYVILTVINAIDSNVEIKYLDRLPDYEATKNLVKTPSNEEDAQENYVKFRATLTKAIADNYRGMI